MQAGEFFVNLGIKGSEKTVGALDAVKTGMSALASMSLEAKAAILGAIYAVEQYMSKSMSLGSNLKNFNALTGESTKTIQQLSGALQKAGVSGDEAFTTISGIQDLMTKLQLNQMRPDWMGWVKKLVGFDELKAGNMDYVLGKMIQLAQVKGLPEGVRNMIIEGFNVPKDVIGAAAGGKLNPSELAKIPFVQEKNLTQLANMNATFTGMGLKWKELFATLTGEHGGGLIGALNLFSDTALSLIKGLDGWVNAAEKFLGITGDKDLNDKGPLLQRWNNFLDTVFPILTDLNPDHVNKAKEFYLNIPSNFRLIPPVIPQNLNIEHTQIFNGPMPNPEQTGHHSRRAVQDAARKSQALKQFN